MMSDKSGDVSDSWSGFDVSGQRGRLEAADDLFRAEGGRSDWAVQAGFAEEGAWCWWGGSA